MRGRRCARHVNQRSSAGRLGFGRLVRHAEGRVVEDAGDQAIAVELAVAERIFHREPAAVPAQTLGGARRLGGSRRRRQVRDDHRIVFEPALLGHEQRQRLPHQLVAAVAEHAFERAIDVADSAFFVEEGDAVAGAFERGLERRSDSMAPGSSALP